MKKEDKILKIIENFLNDEELPEHFSNEGIEKLRKVFGEMKDVFNNPLKSLSEISTKLIKICKFCGEVAENCDGCGKRFVEYDIVIHISNEGWATCEGHYCEKCMKITGKD